MRLLLLAAVATAALALGLGLAVGADSDSVNLRGKVLEALESASDVDAETDAAGIEICSDAAPCKTAGLTCTRFFGSVVGWCTDPSSPMSMFLGGGVSLGCTSDEFCRVAQNPLALPPDGKCFTLASVDLPMMPVRLTVCGPPSFTVRTCNRTAECTGPREVCASVVKSLMDQLKRPSVRTCYPLPKGICTDSTMCATDKGETCVGWSPGISSLAQAEDTPALGLCGRPCRNNFGCAAGEWCATKDEMGSTLSRAVCRPVQTPGLLCATSRECASGRQCVLLPAARRAEAGVEAGACVKPCSPTQSPSPCFATETCQEVGERGSWTMRACFQGQWPW